MFSSDEDSSNSGDPKNVLPAASVKGMGAGGRGTRGTRGTSNVPSSVVVASAKRLGTSDDALGNLIAIKAEVMVGPSSNTINILDSPEVKGGGSIQSASFIRLWPKEWNLDQLSYDYIIGRDEDTFFIAWCSYRKTLVHQVVRTGINFTNGCRYRYES